MGGASAVQLANVTEPALLPCDEVGLEQLRHVEQFPCRRSAESCPAGRECLCVCVFTCVYIGPLARRVYVCVCVCALTLHCGLKKRPHRGKLR